MFQGQAVWLGCNVGMCIAVFNSYHVSKAALTKSLLRNFDWVQIRFSPF